MVSDPQSNAILSSAVESAVGTAGGDFFLAAPGALGPGDRVDGGLGSDVIHLTAAGSLNLQSGAIVTSIESLEGSAGDDTILDGAGSTRIFGGDGADVLDGADGDDVLVGDNNPFAATADQLFGGAGNDILYGEAADLLRGGSGFDVLQAVNAFNFTLDMTATSIEYAILDFGDDVVTAVGQTNAVSVFASGGNDTFSGSAFGDLVFGDVGDDVLAGNGGDDALVGGAGIDQLDGGAGNDRLYFDAQDTVVQGGAGFDAGYITAGAGVVVDLAASSLEFVQDLAGGADTLNAAAQTQGVFAYAGAGADAVTGSAFADVLYGEAGDDVLVGGAGGDVLVGGVGADRLTGGARQDALYGGAGTVGDGAADVFVFAETGTANADAVYGFEHGLDKIDVTALAGGPADLSLVFVAGDSPGQGDTIVYLGGALVCTVVGATTATLTASDFLFATPAPLAPEAAPTQPLDTAAWDEPGWSRAPHQHTAFHDLIA